MLKNTLKISLDVDLTYSIFKFYLFLMEITIKRILRYTLLFYV